QDEVVGLRRRLKTRDAARLENSVVAEDGQAANLFLAERGRAVGRCRFKNRSGGANDHRFRDLADLHLNSQIDTATNADGAGLLQELFESLRSGRYVINPRR